MIICVLSGDFDVPSSREDVDRDSPWNQWLRNEIHVLFIESLDRFKVWHLCVLSGLHGYITGVQCSVVETHPPSSSLSTGSRDGISVC